jgi:arylsulfatase A-like enzyme
MSNENKQNKIMNGQQFPPPDSKFGGVIPTPALDRIAKAGLRYTQFHSTALTETKPNTINQ